MSVWDDGHGISVPKKYQTIKESISEALSGFGETEEKPGFYILKTKAWDYAHLCKTYKKASEVARDNHVPVLVHVEEVTQPQGHSTSGSHERYKTKERLEWEKEYDCNLQFRKWILENPMGENGEDRIAIEEELVAIEKAAKKAVREAKGRAWKAFQDPIKADMNEVINLLTPIIAKSSSSAFLQKLVNDMSSELSLSRKIVVSTVRKALRILRNEDMAEKKPLLDWYNVSKIENYDRFNSYLYSQSADAAIDKKAVAPSFGDNSPMEDGRIILQQNFDAWFEKMPELVAFGEDAGKIGGVNQAFAGLQEKYGENRLFDTGIREATIVGQGIGMALRGLRPIAEIQYLDYLLYGLQTLSDDLCTTHYRTKGGQKAPLLIRTRGHRFEGVWHAGSPMGMILNTLKGMYVCVPRDMTQAAGFYNTLLESDDPAIVIEPLNGYRTKEKLPTNLTEFRTPLGIPEVTIEGTDVTVVTYGSTYKIALQATKELKELGISVELIDVQTLIPFDVNHIIVESLKKTNRLVCMDEDHRGGATGYMLQHILEDQKGYYHLDSEPLTIAAQDHRTAYGDDGDYFTNPSVEDAVEKIYELMSEAKPVQFKPIF
jgi:pyruvate/2-oxoglutarate/acetoin dehydrogenase E1 component